MDILLLVGRIVVGAFFLYSAYNHLTKVKMMSGYAASKGVPLPSLAVVGTGVQMAVGGLMVLLGIYLWVGALVLIAFLVPISFSMHNFWADKDPQMRQMNQINFLKNLTIAGALLMLLAYNVQTGWNPIGLAP